MLNRSAGGAERGSAFVSAHGNVFDMVDDGMLYYQFKSILHLFIYVIRGYFYLRPFSMGISFLVRHLKSML